MTTKLPSELSGSVPRAVTLTKGGVAAAVTSIVLAVAAIVAAIVMSVVYARSLEQGDLRAREAVTSEATIVSVVVNRGEQRRTVVTYRFEAGDRSYTGRAAFRRSQGRAFVPGGRISIGFVPSEPETSWAIGREPGRFPVALIPIVSLLLLGSAGAVAWGIRRQWILLSEGRAALARVTQQKKVQGHNHKYYRLTCEFETLSGSRQTVRCDVRKSPPAVGATVPVIYHRDKPRWTALYPLGLVRPVRAAAPQF